jgi:hypothetical protein
MADDVARFLQMVNERRAQEAARQAQAAAQRSAAPRPGQRRAPKPAPVRTPIEAEIVEAQSVVSPALFDHAVGAIASQAADGAAAPTNQQTQAPQSWADLLRTPAGMRQAFVLSEIMRRPE